jgi:tRNA-modifying protein YgfZ
MTENTVRLFVTHIIGRTNFAAALINIAIILEKSFRPRKTRKPRTKSACCVDLAIHPLGDNLKPGIPLNVFVLFVFFVDQLRFLGLCLMMHGIISEDFLAKPYGMNTNWKTFLLSQRASIFDEGFILSPPIINIDQNSIYPLTHLAVLSVTGKDSAKLLQGQITCNINDISESKSSLAALCNPKGRAIATFLLVKNADSFFLVLPAELLDIVKTRLQMYVLRSDVKIRDGSDDYCLLGLCGPEKPAQAFDTAVQQGLISVNFPASTSRKLLMGDADKTIGFWSGQVDCHNFRMASPGEWRYLDIISGIPWLTTATSEEFIPQMLNLDKLGGISFNKGCYTGQEIVARTHYLGKAKREMFLAECQVSKPPEPNSSIVNRDSDTQEGVGKVLLAQQGRQNCKMLVILQAAEPASFNNLGLKDDAQARLNLLPFNTW